jgi:glyoxylase-like metal-dependent hydrolase (beta-lactamase superfamily II)
MRIGDLEILPVIDSVAVYDPRLQYKKSDEAWETHKDLLTPDGKLEAAMGGFLIRNRSNDRIAIVDLGLGKATMMGQGGQAKMLESLAALGYRPDDVTDIIFTHLHLDHIGWASVDGQPTFKNATYRCHQADWDHWVTGQERRREYHLATQRDLMKPAAGQLETWTGDAALLPGIDARHVPGHTPGNSILVLSHGAERAMLIGDVVHCPMELVDDEWEGYADVDPVAAKAAKNALAREIEGSDIPVAAAHFGGLQFGRLLKGEQRHFVF